MELPAPNLHFDLASCSQLAIHWPSSSAVSSPKPLAIEYTFSTFGTASYRLAVYLLQIHSWSEEGSKCLSFAWPSTPVCHSCTTLCHFRPWSQSLLTISSSTFSAVDAHLWSLFWPPAGLSHGDRPLRRSWWMSFVGRVESDSYGSVCLAGEGCCSWLSYRYLGCCCHPKYPSFSH